MPQLPELGPRLTVVADAVATVAEVATKVAVARLEAKTEVKVGTGTEAAGRAPAGQALAAVEVVAVVKGTAAA